MFQLLRVAVERRPLGGTHVQIETYNFDAPERFVVGTVGQPGERAFFLQASQAGRVVTVGLEKVAVSALADGLVELLGQIRRQPGAAGPAPAAVDRAPLDAPVQEDFRLGGLTVAWDGERVYVEAAGEPEGPAAAPAETLDEDSPEDRARLEALAAAEDTLDTLEAEVAAALDDDLVDAIEAADDDAPAPKLRVALTVAQTRAFVDRAKSVVAAGRKPCILCGRPDGPDGHFCPNLN